MFPWPIYLFNPKLHLKYIFYVIKIFDNLHSTIFVVIFIKFDSQKNLNFFMVSSYLFCVKLYHLSNIFNLHKNSYLINMIVNKYLTFLTVKKIFRESFFFLLKFIHSVAPPCGYSINM